MDDFNPFGLLLFPLLAVIGLSMGFCSNQPIKSVSPGGIEWYPPEQQYQNPYQY
jgi:hypothetical protein